MKPATRLTVILLLAIALLHLFRIVLQVEVNIDGAAVPMWASVIATVVPTALVVGLWREHLSPRSGAA